MLGVGGEGKVKKAGDLLRFTHLKIMIKKDDLIYITIKLLLEANVCKGRLIFVEAVYVLRGYQL